MLPFTRETGRVKESFPINSDTLSTVRSSQFDGVKDLFDRQLAPPSNPRYHYKPRSKPKLRTSWVYDYIPDKDRETRYQTVDGRDEWCCRYYPQRYLIDRGTTIITTHLTSKYSLLAESGRDQQVKNQQRTINKVLREAENHPQKRRKLYHRANRDKINSTVLEILWVNVLVVYSLAIRLLCLPQFRVFLQYLNTDALTFLPTSENTIRH